MLKDLRTMTSAEMSAKYGISRNAVRCAASFNKIKIKREQKSPVYAEDVARLFEIMSDGFSAAYASKKIGVSEYQARRIIRKAEKHGFDAYPPRPKEAA